MTEIKLQITMGAVMKPDVYGGNNCDKVLPLWETWAAGDKGDSDKRELLQLHARTFPPGTKITIEEPRCPKCDELREPTFRGKKRRAVYTGACRCGFDWDAWVLDQFS